MALPQKLRTPVTDIFSIRHPVILAGMNVAAGPKLAAAVTNAGGLGVIGGNGYTPKALREQIMLLKSLLNDPNAPFGVDLLIPRVGGSSRKTNYDYNKGNLDELIDIIIETNTRLFVSAVGIPPRSVVERLHQNGIVYMNMIGHPKHIQKCLDNDVDIICAQGGEGGGHTGDIALSILIPTIASMLQGKKSRFTGVDIQLVAAGGVFNGQSLASALALGASAVWVGTRFLLSEEAGASKAHQEAVRTAGFDDNVRTLIFSGRPMRVRANPYILNWENNRQEELKELISKGIIPVTHDLDVATGELLEQAMENSFPVIMGPVAAVVDEKKSASSIVDELVNGAVKCIEKLQKLKSNL